MLPPAEEVLNIVPWPDGKAPDRFMVGLQIVSLPVAQTRDIVENAKPSETPHLKPEFKTPLAAAQYFGRHLNMGDPPKYMAVYTATDGTKYYIFSGGRHWGKQPIFSEASVLLETGEIRFYQRQTNGCPTSRGR